jgi:hypothetical protein
MLGWQIKFYRGIYDDSWLLMDSLVLYTSLLKTNSALKRPQSPRHFSLLEHCKTFIDGINSFLAHEQELCRRTFEDESSPVNDVIVLTVMGFNIPIAEIFSQVSCTYSDSNFFSSCLCAVPFACS